jgi:hypothetical protein
MIFADANGELDVPAPNTKGWSDTVAFIEANAPADGALRELAETGTTTNLTGLLEELDGLTGSEDADVQEVLDAVEQAAIEAEDVLIVSA